MELTPQQRQRLTDELARMELDEAEGLVWGGRPHEWAVRHLARVEGVITDPVYEGKSIAALIDLVREGYFPEGSRILYAHLGGQPALNAYTEAFTG